MKHVFLALLTTLILSSQANAGGDRIGNGGGLWGCYNSDNSFRSGQLMDLFEAKQQFGLYIPTSGLDTTPVEVLNTRVRWMKANLPAVHAMIEPALVRVQNNLVMTDASLIQIDDAWPKIRPLPTDCLNGEWKYTQFANYTTYDSVLVNNYLWTHPGIPTLDKAALILHEAVYLSLRERFGDQDSVRARHINGLLFSNLPSGEIGKRINSILGGSQPPPPPVPTPVPTPVPGKPKVLGYACTLKNTITDLLYTADASTQIDAEFEVQQNCQKQGHVSYCAEKDVQCEAYTKLVSTDVCIAKNTITDKTYRATGKNKIQATAFAVLACQKDGHVSYCAPLKCAAGIEN
jgi:hypothetical protein